MTDSAEVEHLRNEIQRLRVRLMLAQKVVGAARAQHTPSHETPCDVCKALRLFDRGSHAG